MKPRVSFYIVKHRENLWNTGKTQGKHREFDLGKNVATLGNVSFVKIAKCIIF